MNHHFFKSKAYLVCFTFTIIVTNIYGQKNLVPNYSFEQYTNCPTTINNNPPPPPWYLTCRSYFTSGYAHACANGSGSNYGVPLNFLKNAWNYQPANTGQAYILIDYLFTFHQTLQCQLLDSLHKNKRYYCEFYVNQPQMMKYSCNNHGMLFTNTVVYPDTVGQTCGLLQANPQILAYGNPIISDTVNWVKVSGIYTAQGGEQYISIGNFYTWQNTRFIETNPAGGSGASYFIDDVSVIPLDSMPLQADAGKDTAIYAGDSVFIGSYTNGIDTIQWQIQNTGTAIDSTRPGFWVKPTTNTCYIITQTVNGFSSSDTVCVTIKALPLLIKNYELKISNQKQLENIWTTANEVNVSHYNIQRSINGKDFATIGTVKANNKASNEYEYIDGIRYWELGVSKLYYRVVGVDDDGRKTYSEARTLNFKPQTLNGISVYPNPSKDVVHITGENIKEVKIINCLGQQIATGRNLRNDAIIINTTNFNKGLYIVQVLLVNGKVYNEKLIVQ